MVTTGTGDTRTMQWVVDSQKMREQCKLGQCGQDCGDGFCYNVWNRNNLVHVWRSLHAVSTKECLTQVSRLVQQQSNAADSHLWITLTVCSPCFIHLEWAQAHCDQVLVPIKWHPSMASISPDVNMWQCDVNHVKETSLLLPVIRMNYFHTKVWLWHDTDTLQWDMNRTVESYREHFTASGSVKIIYLAISRPDKETYFAAPPALFYSHPLYATVTCDKLCPKNLSCIHTHSSMRDISVLNIFSRQFDIWMHLNSYWCPYW